MRRALTIPPVLALLLAAIGGCSSGFNERVEAAVKDKEEQAARDEFLKPAEGGKFTQVGMTLRVPKTLSGPKTFALTAQSPPGFDLDSSFDSPALSLHVLARRKAPKAAEAPKKDGEPPAAEPAPRGAFLADATSVLAAAFGSPPAESPKPVTFGRNAFKQLDVQANNKTYRVDFFERHDGANEFDAALIWEFPAGGKSDTSTIDMALKSFAMGSR